RRLGNIGIWLLNVVLAGFVFAAPATFRPQLQAAFGLTLLAWPIADAVTGFVAGFLLLDLLQYAMHRCQHAVPFLWRLRAVHHSVSPAETNANFGAVLSVWDRLFGTYTRLPRAEQERIVFGVRELPRRDAVKPSAMLLTPWLLRRADQARRAASISSLV